MSKRKQRTALPHHVKVLIVERLASFDPALVVVGRLQRDHGISVSRQVVERYDAAKRSGARLSPTLRKLFEEVRATSQKAVADIGVAHLPVRLKNYERLALRAEAAGDFLAAGRLNALAARDQGGMFTNARTLHVVEPFEAKTLDDFYGGRQPDDAYRAGQFAIDVSPEVQAARQEARERLVRAGKIADVWPDGLPSPKTDDESYDRYHALKRKMDDEWTKH